MYFRSILGTIKMEDEKKIDELIHIIYEVSDPKDNSYDVNFTVSTSHDMIFDDESYDVGLTEFIVRNYNCSFIRVSPRCIIYNINIEEHNRDYEGWDYVVPTFMNVIKIKIMEVYSKKIEKKILRDRIKNFSIGFVIGTAICSVIALFLTKRKK